MSRFSKILLAAAVAGAAFLAPAVAEAQTATGSMTVTASVAKSCVVQGPTGAVDFPAYDPVSSTQQQQNATIQVRCVKGTGYSIGLTSANGWKIRSASGGDIPYEIWQPGTSTAWNDLTKVVVSPGAVSGNGYLSYVGQVRPGLYADVSAANDFKDTVTITVTY